MALRKRWWRILARLTVVTEKSVLTLTNEVAHMGLMVVFDVQVMLLGWIRLVAPIPMILGFLFWCLRKALRWYFLKPQPGQHHHHMRKRARHMELQAQTHYHQWTSATGAPKGRFDPFFWEKEIGAAIPRGGESIRTTPPS